MKIRTLAFATALALASWGASAADKHSHDPKFGGVVVETKVGDVEIVAKPDMIRIYISDHGKAVKFEGAIAKVTLLNGTEKSEAQLTPSGDKLEAKGTFKVARGTKGIAVITLVGKPPTTARFEVK